MNIYKNITNFFFELGVLKRIMRSGWMIAGVKDTGTLGEHTARASLIGMVLAELEGSDSEKVAAILLTHDIAEIRIGDQHKVAARYYDNSDAEQKAYEDQIVNLPQSLQEKFLQYRREFERRDTKEGVVAKDADWLEAAVTAREYITQGYTGCQNWIYNVKKALETESAKKLLAEIEKSDPNDWWQNLKKMTYEKLNQNVMN